MIKGLSKRSSKSNKMSYAYLAPALITIIIFTVLPIAYSVYMAFTNYSLNTMNNYKFIGVQNFIDILTGPFKNVFFPVFTWNIFFAFASTAATFLVGLIIALVLSNKLMKEAFIYKALLIIPWALPATIAIISWQGLLNTQYGAINLFLMKLHIIKEPVMWLADKWFARIAIIIVNIWLGFPYMMNVCVGAISAIPETFYEAAEIDGASKWIQFSKITLPSLTATAYPLLISSFAFNFNNFGSAFLITGGGPANPTTQYAGYTDILASTTYKLTIQFYQYGVGSALAIIIFLLIGTISFIQMRSSGQFREVD